MHLIDCIAHTNRWQSRHPGEKAALALGLLVAAMILPWTGSLAVLVVVAATALIGARIPWRTWVRVMSLPCLFLLASGVILVVGVGFTDTGFRVALRPDQLAFAGKVILRALAAAACLNLLAMTTPAYDWIPLMRHGRIPAVVLSIMLMVYRMFFLLLEQATVIRTSQTARLGYAGRRNAFRSYGALSANLLTRAMDRAGRMELCLEARGDTGEIRMLPSAARPTGRFAVFCALTFSAVVLAGWLGRG